MCWLCDRHWAALGLSRTGLVVVTYLLFKLFQFCVQGRSVLCESGNLFGVMELVQCGWRFLRDRKDASCKFLLLRAKPMSVSFLVSQCRVDFRGLGFGKWQVTKRCLAQVVLLVRRFCRTGAGVNFKFDRSRTDFRSGYFKLFWGVRKYFGCTLEGLCGLDKLAVLDDIWVIPKCDNFQATVPSRMG